MADSENNNQGKTGGAAKAAAAGQSAHQKKKISIADLTPEQRRQLQLKRQQQAKQKQALANLTPEQRKQLQLKRQQQAKQKQAVAQQAAPQQPQAAAPEGKEAVKAPIKAPVKAPIKAPVKAPEPAKPEQAVPEAPQQPEVKAPQQPAKQATPQKQAAPAKAPQQEAPQKKGITMHSSEEAPALQPKTTKIARGKKKTAAQQTAPAPAEQATQPQQTAAPVPKKKKKKKTILDRITSLVMFPFKLTIKLLILKPLGYFFGDTIKAIGTSIKTSLLGKICGFIARSPIGKLLGKPYRKVADAVNAFFNTLGGATSKVFVVILLTIVLTYFFFLPLAIERLAPKAFAMFNIPVKSLEVEGITRSTMEFSNVRAKDDSFVIDGIGIMFDKEKIFDFTLDNVTVIGLSINGKQSSGSVSFGAFEDMIKGYELPEEEEIDNPNENSIIKRIKGLYKRLSTRLAGIGIIKRTKEQALDMIASTWDSFIGDKRITIASINVEESKINIKSDDKTQSIDFSLSGNLDSSYFSIDAPLEMASDGINIKTKLKASGWKDSIDVNFYVTEGSIKTESINADKVSAGIKFKTKDGVVTKGNTKLELISPDISYSIEGTAKPVNTMVSGVNKHDIEINFKKSVTPEGAFQPIVTDAKFIGQGAIFKGDFGSFSGQFPSTELVINNLSAGKFSAVQTKIQAPGTLKYKNKKLSYYLDYTGTAVLSNPRLVDEGYEVRTDKPQKISLMKSESPAFSVKNNRGTIEYLPNLLMKMKADIKIQKGYESIPVSLNLAESIFSGKFSDDVTFKYNINNSDIEFSEHSLKETSAEINYSSKAKSTAVVNIGNLTLGKKKKYLLPLMAAIAVEGDSNTINFDTRFSLTDGTPFLAATGLHEPLKDMGQADIALQKIVFREGSMQPSDYFPLLKKKVDYATGILGLNGQVLWKEGEIQSALQLLLQDMTFSYGGINIANVNTVIDITNPWPLTTAPSQFIHANMIDMVVPIDNAMLLFNINEKGEFVVENAALAIAEGEITLENAVIPLAQTGSKIVLNAKNINLETMSEIVNLENFNATGTVSGRLPMNIDANEIAVSNGKVWAEKIGTIIYTPDVKPKGKGIKTLLEALKNFEYEKLDLTIEGSTSKKTNINLQLKGSNPDLYNGRSIELNTNLQGNIGKFLKRKIQQYDIPSQIAERINQFK